MRDYVVDGLPPGSQYNAALRRNVQNGDVVTADPEIAEGVPWLKDPGEIGKPAGPPPADEFGELSPAATKAADKHELTPARALELGVVGLKELGISDRSAKAIVKASAGNG